MENQDQIDFDNQVAGSNFICVSCENPIDGNVAFYSGHPYHSHCVKCMICHKCCTSAETVDDFIDVTPGFFFCIHHYNEYLVTRRLPTKVQKDIREKRIKNIIKEEFETSQMCEGSIKLNKPYELFLPTALFHFDIEIESVDFEKLHDLIKDDAIIVGIDRGSLFLKLAFIDYFSDQMGSNAQKSFQNVKSKFCSTLGKSIIGNLINEPKLTIPDDRRINELLNKPSMNLLQNNEKLNEVELNNLVKLVLEHAQSDDHKMYVNFLINKKEDYENAEKMIKKDISQNQYEMVIVAESVIANKSLDEFQKIKNSIYQSDKQEGFLYHGSGLGNHFGIIENGFYVPNGSSGSHGALFGLGVYATENLFYACRYANGNYRMKIYKRVPVLLCKTIYNRKKKVEITFDTIDDYISRPASDDVKKNYGVHHALVGRDFFWCAVDPRSFDTHITGDEYVFPNSNQIIPICSFTVMRSDHYVLWKDEHIDTDYNQSYFRSVNEKIQVNMYGKKTVDEALDVIRLKIRNRVKLITNGGDTFTGRRLINEARNIVGSNFICLVFSYHTHHSDWIVKTENVLYTNYIDMFEKFSLLKMEEKSILDFINELEKLQNLKFKINKTEMLNFPFAEFDT